MAGLITQCPGCASSFKVTSVQLQVAGGKVRCGTCQQIFNGNEHIIAKQVISDKGFIEKPIDSDDLLIYDDMPLEEDQSELAGAKPDLIPVETFEQITEDKTEAFSIPSPTDFLEPPVLLEDHQRQKPTRLMLWLPLIILSATSLILQFMHFNALAVVQKIPIIEPVMSQLCEITGCQLFGYNVEKLVVVDLQVASHPKQSGALQISGSLVNQATFPQQMPTLLIAFDSLEGTTVAQRGFNANEYLQGHIPSNGLLPAKRKLNFMLNIVDPGKAAQSYSVEVY